MGERTEADVRMELAEQRSRLRDARDSIRSLISEVQDQRRGSDLLKKERDDAHVDARRLVEEAKLHQSKRDEINQMATDLRSEKREANAELRKKIDALISTKRERQTLDRKAGASKEFLAKQLVGGMITLFSMDMALKNEAVMFEMVFEWRDRFGVKEKADDAHSRLQNEWDAKSEAEAKAQTLYEEIGRLLEASNHEHSESIRSFQEKDEARARANGLHQEWIDKGKEIRETQKRINDAKREADEIAVKVRALDKELIKRVGWKRAKEDQREFEGVKQKMDGGGKLSMEELKLLLDKGALK